MKDLIEALKPGSKDWVLATAIDPGRLPAHIAIIMDGNGRWVRGAICRAWRATRPAWSL